MTGTAELADCHWHEPGGRAAAEAIAAFLESAGIAVEVTPLTGQRFLPALAVDCGTIQIEPGGRAYPGDLLHEAGHVAVMTAERRAVPGEVGADPADEMAAIAWSAAAAKACGVSLDVLFHGAGYKGGGDGLAEAFADNRGPGVPMLDWYGMTAPAGFPVMARWLR